MPSKPDTLSQPRTPRYPHKRYFGVGIVVMVVVIGGTLFAFSAPKANGPSKAADSFARAWSAGHIEQATYVGQTGVGQSGADVLKSYQSAAGNLAATAVTASVRHVRNGTATFHVTWNLSSGPWSYDTTARVAKTKGTWAVDWSPAVVYPTLTAGTHLAEQRTKPTRGDLLGGDGTPIVTLRPTVDVGVVPNRVKNVDALSTQLANLLHINGPALAGQIRAAAPNQFVEVITLRRDDYQAMKSALQPIPGTVFNEGNLPLAPSRYFASALLGRVGPVTAEIVQKSNGRYQSGDIGGLSGLEQQYDSRLAGKPGVQVNLVDPSKPADQQTTTLYSVPSVPGQTVQTTLDEHTQNLADAAIGGQTKPTSFVVMQVSTGKVLAVSNGPEAGGADNALTGRYPPGSSFKVVSTYALLQKGVQANDNVACPPTINIGGREFHNAENESFASAPFHTDFAKSCNTAFISLSPKLNKTSLPDTAAQFGLGAAWNMGTPVFTGSVPAATDNVDLAAATFGQGRILMSPMAMANVAATVARGSWEQPTLVTDPPTTPLPSTQLDQPTIQTLKTFMREVVTSGTGTAAGNVPGGPVYGKTGTAEFGTDNPPKSHAWFIGFRDDIAFGVFVEGGEFGGDTAAPIAGNFLNLLAQDSTAG